ncbi:GNAT family N-acetyltransferase [Streptosporangium lutulentum]
MSPSPPSIQSFMPTCYLCPFWQGGIAGRWRGERPGIRLRPAAEDDLAMFRRFAVEPGLVGLDWMGFRDAQAPARRFAVDGYLGEEDSRVIVEVDGTAAGFMSWSARGCGFSRYWEIGIALLPDWRGRGVGWRAQGMLCDYLFTHTPAQRVEAATHPENIAEQKSLEKAASRWRASCARWSSATASGATAGCTAGYGTIHLRWVSKRP